jgi:hypothetical protein
VNRYNISLVYKLKSYKNEPWVRKKVTKQSSGRNLSADGASIGTIRGEAGLASFFFILLVLLISIPIFKSI